MEKKQKLKKQQENLQCEAQQAYSIVELGYC